MSFLPNRMTLPVDSGDLTLGVTPEPDGDGGGQVTARRAGQLADMLLPISPSQVGPKLAMRNMAKALNLALLTDFLETELDSIYKGVRVYRGKVEIHHEDYIGLGDGLFAQVGKLNKSFQLTLKGPDAASPEGKALIAKNGGGSISGILNLMGRKLNLLQEYEDKVPVFLQQTLDRLEAKRMVTDWNADEWKIETTTIGLDVIMTPIVEQDESAS